VRIRACVLGNPTSSLWRGTTRSGFSVPHKTGTLSTSRSASVITERGSPSRPKFLLCFSWSHGEIVTFSLDGCTVDDRSWSCQTRRIIGTWILLAVNDLHGAACADSRSCHRMPIPEVLPPVKKRCRHDDQEPSFAT
jgi:hypothetical protein